MKLELVTIPLNPETGQPDPAVAANCLAGNVTQFNSHLWIQPDRSDLIVVVGRTHGRKDFRKALGDAGFDRFERLRAWRNRRAQALRMPAYIVLPNQVLADIAAVNPHTTEALSAIKGLGPRRIQLYGDELIAALCSDAAVALD